MEMDKQATDDWALSYTETEIHVVPGIVIEQQIIVCSMIKNTQVQALREDVQDRSIAITKDIDSYQT